MSNLDFTRANFTGSDLIGVDFSISILALSNFTGAEIFGVEFDDAIFCDTIISEDINNSGC